VGHAEADDWANIVIITDCRPCAQAKVRFYVKRSGACQNCGAPQFRALESGQLIYTCGCQPGIVITEAMRVDADSFGVMAWQ